MKVSDNLIKFIGSYETSDGKPHLKAVKSPEQPDPKNVKYEIGWGHNSDEYFTVSKDSEITYEKACDLLRYDIWQAEFSVKRFCVKHNLTPTQNEFDAMVSAAYNGVGIGNESYGITKAIIKGDPAEIEKCWKQWNKMTVNGKKVVAGGLVKRRADELNIFFNGVYKRTS